MDRAIMMTLLFAFARIGGGLGPLEGVGLTSPYSHTAIQRLDDGRWGSVTLEQLSGGERKLHGDPLGAIGHSWVQLGIIGY